MPKQIQKSLQHYLAKIKIPNKQIQLPWSGCKHVKTTSLIAGGGGGDATEDKDSGVTLSDIDRFLFENFKSLYQEECEEAISKKKSPFQHESPRNRDPPPLENIRRARRLFVESGSPRSRITDETFSPSSSSSSSAMNDSSTASEDQEAAAVVDGSFAPEDFIALLRYSPSPYEDFRRSMQEMVAVRLEHNGKVDWPFLEELLSCYMELNNKKSYRHILRAFVDIIVVLRGSSGNSPPPFKGRGRTSQPE